MLIFDVLSPLVLPEQVPDYALALGAPDEVRILPGMDIGMIVMDHGKEYENFRVVDALARLGASIEFARTRRGMDKPYVESANRIKNIMQENLGGYVGISPENRGKAVEASLSLSALDAICQDWSKNFYPHRPHGGLRSQTDPRKLLTPAEKYQQCLIRGGGIHVNPHPDDIFGFLDSVEHTVSSDGVKLLNLRYDGPILNQIRHGVLSPLARPGRKRRFYFDPCDRSRLFFRDDADGRWYVLHAIHDDGTTFPPFSDLVTDDLVEFLGRGTLPRGQRDSAEVKFGEFADLQAELNPERWSNDRARVESAVRDPESNPGGSTLSGLKPPVSPPVDVAVFGDWHITDADVED